MLQDDGAGAAEATSRRKLSLLKKAAESSPAAAKLVAADDDLNHLLDYLGDYTPPQIGDNSISTAVDGPPSRSVETSRSGGLVDAVT